MGMTKHFIEFCDHIFAIEDVHCVEKYYTWTGNDDNKIWKSAVYLNVKDRNFTFPQTRYDELKQILLNFNNNDSEKI